MVSHRFICRLVPPAACLLIAGCTTLDQIAPPVTGGPHLAEGRRIYTSQCTACHVAEPVKKYTLAEWDRILPEMIAETKLNSSQAAAVTAYVRAAHALPAN